MPTIDKKYYHNIDLDSNELKAGRIYNLDNYDITQLALSLTNNDKGYIVYNLDYSFLQFWDGSNWQNLLSGLAGGTVTSVSAGTGMSFTTITTTGSISIDTTKVPYLASGFSTGFLKWNGSSWTFDTTSYLANSMSTNKLIGRSSAGTGVMEEISLGTGLSFSGTTLNNTATFTSPLTTKGDIYVRNSSVDTRLPIGLDTQILIADSTATTGMKWGSNTAATPTGYYGAWQDNITQTAAVNNTGYAMIFRTIDISNGVTVVTNGTNLTRITFANTGVYNLQFSSQFQNTHNVDEDVTIWLRKNGTDVTGSSGFISVPSSHGGTPGHIIAGWNYLLNVIAGEYYELIWSTTDAVNVTMQFYAAGSPPPSAASVILTVTQQSGIMAGTGITAINSLTGSVQTMVSGTSGTDFAISSTGSTHTFNLPTASSINTGKLSSADWSIFNNKQNALTNPITGTGTNNELAYFNTTGSTIGSLSTTTYPSLTELSYVKGVTSSIQTQLNSKQGTLTLTTTGSSGSATFTINTLNIPTYTLAGLGGQASSTNLTSLSGLTFVSTSFVKMTAAGTFALDTNTYYLASNPSGFTNNTGTVTSVAALTLGTTGTDLSSTVATGTTTPVITLNVPTASATNRGALSSADWSTFNGKQGAITLTTTGTSGAATLVGNTLNIPQYSGGGSGMSIGGSITSATAGSILFAGTSGVLAQDNTNFFWDNTNKRLGLGTASPSTLLNAKVTSNSNVAVFEQDSNSTTIAASNAVLGIRNNNTTANTYSLLSFQHTGAVGYARIGSIYLSSTDADFTFQVRSSNVLTDAIYIKNTTNVIIGGTTDAGFKFDINGTARAVTSLDTPILRGGTGSGGTLTLSSTSNATKGKILFGTGAYDEVNNALGIGTTSPSEVIHVIRTAGAGSYFRMDTLTGAPGIQTYRANGTVSVPTTVASGDIIGLWGMRGYNGSAWITSSRAYIGGYASETWSTTANGTYLVFATTPTGTLTTTERLRIENDGNVLIGTTTNGSFKLDVNGTARVQGALNFNPTNTAAGTTGNQTINKASGTVNIAAAGTTVTVTNSLVTASSIVFAVIRTNDATATIKNVVPAAGSFTINLNAATTAETSIGFFVIN